eukprot:gnl/MRDRNA2_/MRDRNA2_136818_c0_seq1.p1 gnl/MRDRNA2_/MRDRNA2_136818_c0~~gnl/MRDRNA2_/MRDRNA2_136818_c0_seq1.p1  ORF type:complete len:157 (-),score=25.32 gnl/MRDRNA2_/MRDRNA2_136818_c0_seq1:299-769(-)
MSRQLGRLVLLPLFAIPLPALVYPYESHKSAGYVRSLVSAIRDIPGLDWVLGSGSYDEAEASSAEEPASGDDTHDFNMAPRFACDDRRYGHRKSWMKSGCDEHGSKAGTPVKAKGKAADFNGIFPSDQYQSEDDYLNDDSLTVDSDYLDPQKSAGR